VGIKKRKATKKNLTKISFELLGQKKPLLNWYTNYNTSKFWWDTATRNFHHSRRSNFSFLQDTSQSQCRTNCVCMWEWYRARKYTTKMVLRGRIVTGDTAYPRQSSLTHCSHCYD